MKIISFYASTVDAMARANGPYTFPCGTAISFVGGPTTVNTSYHWDFGDGSGADARVADHTYADDGVYVAKLTTTVTEPGGVTTRQFAKVTITNVPAIVDPSPDYTEPEGAVAEYSVTFHTPEWPDKHTATFDFGDDSTPVPATVTETNVAPEARGTASAKHAYCKRGDYNVTVTVVDDDGGVGTGSFVVHVNNVPPKVTADDIFTYGCTPLTLRACFTDPGWCKTHTATWDFGDCAPISPAVVVETHTPPAGRGSASAVHCYDRCGEFHATCVVTDSEGGSGSASITVRVVDLRNKDFGEGFHQLQVGQVPNGWEPYQMQIDGETFAAEPLIVDHARRALQISGQGNFCAGVYQLVGANKGWSYQFSGWYDLDERRGGRCRIGLDPLGGTDPTAPSIVWSEERQYLHWSELVVVATAKGAALTVFMEVTTLPPPLTPPFGVPDPTETQRDALGAVAYFDRIALLPYLWTLRDCFGDVKREITRCVDWKSEKEARQVPSPYVDDIFTFASLVQQALRIVISGAPAGGKLLIPARGLEVKLAQAADSVIATIFADGKAAVEMTAFAADGTALGSARTVAGTSGLQQATVGGPGIARIVLAPDIIESALVELCATLPAG